jgi:hypothetical protein
VPVSRAVGDPKAEYEEMLQFIDTKGNLLASTGIKK